MGVTHFHPAPEDLLHLAPPSSRMVVVVEVFFRVGGLWEPPYPHLFGSLRSKISSPHTPHFIFHNEALPFCFPIQCIGFGLCSGFCEPHRFDRELENAIVVVDGGANEYSFDDAMKCDQMTWV